MFFEYCFIINFVKVDSGCCNQQKYPYIYTNNIRLINRYEKMSLLW